MTHFRPARMHWSLRIPSPSSHPVAYGVGAIIALHLAIGVLALCGVGR